MKNNRFQFVLDPDERVDLRFIERVPHVYESRRHTEEMFKWSMFLENPEYEDSREIVFVGTSTQFSIMHGFDVEALEELEQDV